MFNLLADPETDRIVVIEINPRTSRSSASIKSNRFPIALVSAMLAAGLTMKIFLVVNMEL